MVTALDLIIINGVFLALSLALFMSRFQKSPKIGVLLGLLVVSDVLTCVLPEVQVGATSLFAFVGFAFSLALYMITRNIFSFVALLEVFAPQLPIASIAVILSTIPPGKFKPKYQAPPSKIPIQQQQVPAVMLSPLRDGDY